LAVCQSSYEVALVSLTSTFTYLSGLVRSSSGHAQIDFAGIELVRNSSNHVCRDCRMISGIIALTHVRQPSLTTGTELILDRTPSLTSASMRTNIKWKTTVPGSVNQHSSASDVKRPRPIGCSPRASLSPSKLLSQHPHRLRKRSHTCDLSYANTIRGGVRLSAVWGNGTTFSFGGVFCPQTKHSGGYSCHDALR
jgi:hypothetical protein